MKTFSCHGGRLVIHFPEYSDHGLIHGGTWNLSTFEEKHGWSADRVRALTRALRTKRKLLKLRASRSRR